MGGLQSGLVSADHYVCFTKDGGTSSEQLKLIVHKGVQEFCRLFQTSQFDKMAQFYAPDTTLMLPHRPVIRGADKLPVLFRELRESGLHDWQIEPNRIEQFGDTALEYGTYSAVSKQPNGTDIADTGWTLNKPLVKSSG
jgi:ketosteroid isomerase-like protein